MGHQLDLFRPTVNEALVRAYERIEAGLVDETGRERAEGPRLVLSEPQRRNHASLTGRCPDHGAEACCACCTSTTDGVGFPHPVEAKGRKRYQECKHCSDWVEPEHWVNDIRGAWFGCSWCAYYLNYASSEQCPEETTAPERNLSGLGCT